MNKIAVAAIALVRIQHKQNCKQACSRVDSDTRHFRLRVLNRLWRTPHDLRAFCQPSCAHSLPFAYWILCETGRFGARRADELRAVRWQHRWSRKCAAEPTPRGGLACVACRSNVTSRTIQPRDSDGACQPDRDGLEGHHRHHLVSSQKKGQAFIRTAEQSTNAWVNSDEQWLLAKVTRAPGARDWW